MSKTNERRPPGTREFEVLFTNPQARPRDPVEPLSITKKTETHGLLTVYLSKINMFHCQGLLRQHKQKLPIVLGSDFVA
jgi:hypothetical protein